MQSVSCHAHIPARPPLAFRALLTMVALLMTGLLAAPQFAVSAAIPPTVLGTAQGFLVLGGSAVTNTGPTIVTGGSLGVSPGTAITGFPPGIVVAPGAIHAADAAAAQAQSDVTTAYNTLAGQARTATLTGQDLGGKVLTQGVYFYATSAQLTGQLTLDAQGDAGAVFVFQIGSTLTTASNASVLLVNGASPCNVYWQVGSSATLGTSTRFVGNILALTSIALNTGTSVSGRALARNGATTLNTNTFTSSACAAIPATATPVPTTATPVPVTATPVPPTATPIPATATVVPNTAIPATGTPVIPATGVPVGSTGTPATPIPATGMPVASTGTPATAVPATATMVPVVSAPMTGVPVVSMANPVMSVPSVQQSALPTPIIGRPVASGPNGSIPNGSGPNGGVPFYPGTQYSNTPVYTVSPNGVVTTAIPATAIPATATAFSRTLALVGSSVSTPASSTATAPPIPVSLPNTGGGGMATHFTATAAGVNDHGTTRVLWMLLAALVALGGTGLVLARRARR